MNAHDALTEIATLLEREPHRLGAAVTELRNVTTYRSYMPNPNGQWMTDADDRRWWFESGALVLDFAYTGRVGDDPRTTSRAIAAIDRPADLAGWIAERFEHFDGVVGEGQLRDALLFRDAIARAVREGIGHDGRALFPIMPYGNYRKMSDEDLASVFRASMEHW
jgi:hypothetical protein